MRWPLATAFVFAAAPAWAGSCCVGSTTSVPARLGPQEHQLAALSATGQTSFGRWDSAGRLATSSLHERSFSLSLALSQRLSPTLQLGASVPVVVHAPRAGKTSSLAAGVGDAAVSATWLPTTERGVAPGAWGPPVFTLSGAVRVPTGTSWRHADDPLLADVTGLPGPSLAVTAGLQRTLGDTPWSVSLTEDVGRAPALSTSVTTLSGGIGRYLSTRWTLLAQASHTESVTWFKGAPARASHTNVGGRVVVGRPLRRRAWLGASTDLPVRALGNDRLASVSVTAGVSIVR